MISMGLSLTLDELVADASSIGRHNILQIGLIKCGKLIHNLTAGPTEDQFRQSDKRAGGAAEPV